MYYQEKVSDVLKNLNTSKKGLSTFEFKKRLKKYGSNELKSRSKISVLKLFFAQLKSFIIYVLIVAALVSFSFGEIVDGSVIITIVILNTLIGFFQEYKAEKAIEKLKELSNPKSIVVRNGKKVEIDSRDLVPGDIVVIREGDFISADCRLIEVNSLKVDESTLTGESLPVEKSVDVVAKKVIVGD